MEAELDKVIGCDFKRIPDVLKRLHAHKESLVNKVLSNGRILACITKFSYFVSISMYT